MAEKNFNTRITHKIDTTSNWNSANIILKKGELGVEIVSTKELRMKVGDGINPWKTLPYSSGTICSIVKWS